MVLDVVDGAGAMLPGARGWRSVIKVRMLHSRVRLRLLGSATRRPATPWDTERDGLPINQEDMVATLLSFSSNVLNSIAFIGAPHLSTLDQRAYLHLWRYVGHLIGVSAHNDPLRAESPEVARGATESVVLHLTLEPNASSRAVAANVLRAVSGRAPQRWAAGMHSACARTLIGTELADALDLPKPSYFHRACAAALFALLLVLNCVLAPFITSDSFLERRARNTMRLIINRELKRQPDAVAAFNPNLDENHAALAAAGGAGTCPFGGALSTTEM